MKRKINSVCFLVRALIFLLVISCKKDKIRYYPETDRTIQVSENISVDNGFYLNNPTFNLFTYENFLSYLSSSDHFIIVPEKEFGNTFSNDKVVLSLRYDIDFNIDASVRFAYREYRYGIHSTYFVLHTADYYGKTTRGSFIRNDNVIDYLKLMQNSYGQEIGFHNDLVTLQIVYGIPSREFLRNELEFLRSNGLNIVGTTYHGSQFCYKYKYYNAYFWIEYPNSGWNYDYVPIRSNNIIIEKDSLQNYGFKYEGGLLKADYFFSDVFFVNGKRWNMNMVDFDTIKPGKKVIVLLHPALWE
jgi:hypothetical protein